MGVYVYGTSVIIRETFYLESVPGDFSTAVPTDPTTVVFSLRKPNDDLLTYLFGVDTEVTNPSVGVYVLTIAASVLTPAGFWTYRCEGTGAVQAAAEGDFEILASSVLEPVVAPPGFAPCQNWCEPEDIAALCSGSDAGSDWTQYDWAARAASELLFQLSGMRFTGICRQTVRPFNDSCGCWPWIVWPASPGVPQMPVGFGFGWGMWGGSWGWGWNGTEVLGTCGAVSRVLLPGYPVTSIEEVTIDGATIDSDGYRLDGWQYLTRLEDLTTGQPRFWPSCQNLSAPLGEPGTWGVTCTTGQAPPVLGQRAAAQLGCEMFLQLNGQDCKLPQGVTSVQRQGLSFQLEPFRAWGQINGQWATGLYAVDAFLAAYNPGDIRQPSTVWSPDDDPFAVRLGTGTGA